MSVGAESTTSSLIDRLRCRDAVAWRRLVTIYGPLVYRWCRLAGLGPEESADRGQEVFLAVARSIERFDAGQPGCTFRGWLWRITQNKIRDHLRRGSRHQRALGGTSFLGHLEQIPDDDSCSAADSCEVSPQEAASLYRRAIELIRAEFEPRTWQAFWVVAVDGRSPAEAGQALGMSPVAVRKAKSRILQRLRQELAGLAPD
jgi:RNA polymerase sigma-70 factor (ECF subfamily)